MAHTFGGFTTTSPATCSRAGVFSRLFTAMLWIQGVYYSLTGLWPLVSINTFIMVTGEKTDNLPTGLEIDHWLVMTAGVLITALGLTLLVGAWRRSNPLELAVLVIAAGVGLTGIDVVYVLRGVIQPIYLLDAAVEVILIAAWIVVLIGSRGQEERERAV